MRINFFDDPLAAPRPREEVRLNQVGVFVYPDLRRVQVGYELTPFLERPSLDMTITNQWGDKVASMTVIETMDRSFSMVLHLREPQPAGSYEVLVEVYYRLPEGGQRMTVDRQVKQFKLVAGEKRET